jgi:hypothetical protein
MAEFETKLNGRGQSHPPFTCEWHAHRREFFVCALLVGSFCFSIMLPSAAAVTMHGHAVAVDPKNGNDNPGCNLESPCKTISYAIQTVGASFVSLAPAVFNEPNVNITGADSLVISGVPSATVFDCSRRPQTTGPAFNIVNSAVMITGISFQSCYNPTSNGGAISAIGSSILATQCSFINCSAASGGAISVIGDRPSDGLFLNVQSSNFTGNSAKGSLVGCPQDAALPCSTWGGAVAAFEIYNVTISGCVMMSNNVNALIPSSSKQINSVAGGGCVSVLFNGNASGSLVYINGSTFTECTVIVSKTDNIMLGNGAFVLVRDVHGTACLIRYRIRRRGLGLLRPLIWTEAAGRVTLQY